MNARPNSRFAAEAAIAWPAVREGTAFTLLEVMLAIVIFSIVLVAIHTVFFAAVQLRNKTSAAIDEAVPLQQALAVMKRDLANILLPTGTFAGELQTTLTTTTSTNSLSSISPVNDAMPGQSGPAFFTATGTIGEELPWGDIQRVTYFLSAPTNNTPGKTLIRSVTRNLLPVIPEEPENQPLLNGLQSILFSFYDGVQWREHWDSTIESNKLPLGIKVELQMAANETDRIRPAPIELVVPVILQAGTNSTAQSGSSSNAGGEL